MKKITADFETISRANLKQVGAWEYSLDPSTFATCLGFKEAKKPTVYLLKYDQMRTHWTKLPSGFRDLWIDWVLGQAIFSAHNAFFEQCIYNNVLVRRFGWPPIPGNKWRCTAAKAAVCAIPRNLAGAGAVQRLTIQKDYEGHRVMMKLCKPTAAWNARLKLENKKRKTPSDLEKLNKPKPPEFWTPETAPEDYETLYKYCKIDVVTEEKLDESLPDLNPFEQKLWFLDQKINMRGVPVDMPLVNKISAIMESEGKTMTKELDVLTMGLVQSGNARDAILDFLTLENIELPDLRAKTVDDFLASGKATGDAEKILKIRRALSKSSTAKYRKFQQRAASDGRVRDICMYHGASTGRWSGVGIQPQNFPRGVIKDIYEAIHQIKTQPLDDLKMLYGANLMPLFSSVLRGMFVATDGHELFVEDLSAIECRVTWWLAGHEDGLGMFRQDEDPYVDMAMHIFKLPKHLITEEMRQVGKAAVLGCGFQMGGKKFVTSAWTVYRAKVTADMAKIAVTKYRERHWPVTELWESYNNAAIMAIENKGNTYRVGKVKFNFSNSFLWITLPSGRKLAYKDPSVVWKTVFLDAEGSVGTPPDPTHLPKGWRSFQSKSVRYWAVNHMAKKGEYPIDKWTPEHSYGGKWVENIVQAVSRDILAEAMVRAEADGFKVLMHSHDELVCEAPMGKFPLGRDKKGNIFCPKFREIMERTPDWAEGLPLKSSGWVNTRYRKG